MHRDIKPSNILLENGVERVKITDFGLRGPPTTADHPERLVAGTPEYMSPEQAREGNVDHRRDLFSLGQRDVRHVYRPLALPRNHHGRAPPRLRRHAASDPRNQP